VRCEKVAANRRYCARTGLRVPKTGRQTVHDEIDERRRGMMAAIAARLARVRGNMTDAEVGQLLADMVKVAERFGEIDARPGAMCAAMSQEEILCLFSITPGWGKITDGRDSQRLSVAATRVANGC